MVQVQTLSRDWNCPVVVAATGPSLTTDVAARVRKARWPEKRVRVVAVNDAFRLLPHADALYACDNRWWEAHIAAVRDGFFGERWTTHEDGPSSGNCKDEMPEDWGIRCVRGKASEGFSRDPALIHYGSNSGFQALNFALLRGATKVILVGFDMRVVNGKRHFFGDHPAPLSNSTTYSSFIRHFETAAKHCAVPIVNATPGSALNCFPKVSLDDALADTAARPHDLLHRDGTVAHAAAG